MDYFKALTGRLKGKSLELNTILKVSYTFIKLNKFNTFIKLNKFNIFIKLNKFNIFIKLNKFK
ncbi:MAG: hypothetical protein CMG04_09245 [Candidatus Marinimicrobia bacterium]|nr:hypothetical protein [Candidatus Neomarinimicrobiota bacterium]